MWKYSNKEFLPQFKMVYFQKYHETRQHTVTATAYCYCVVKIFEHENTNPRLKIIRTQYTFAALATTMLQARVFILHLIDLFRSLFRQ